MIKLKDMYKVFFPTTFSEKYRYLGVVPYNEGSELFNAILPLVLTMDYYAKPKWCPRWFLRLIHLLGNDNSIVRVRSWFFHNLHRRLTGGILMLDYKLKWSDYDLRISIRGNELLVNLADDIENSFYRRGRRKYVLEELYKIPNSKEHYNEWDSLSKLEDVYRKLTEGDE
jgi:hypothetical protein